MAKNEPRYSKEEFAARGDAIYESKVRPRVQQGNEGKFVAIDIETGEYELGENEIEALDKLRTRLPEAQIWLRRVGSPYAHRFGGFCEDPLKSPLIPL